MTLRTRILVFNLGTFASVLMVIGVLTYFEFAEEQEFIVKHADKELRGRPAHEALEIVLYGGAVSLLLALLVSRLFLWRALKPIVEFTDTLEMTQIENLGDPVKRSGNGDELDRLAVVFNRMKQRLELSFTQSREFTAHASHEIKTPLTIMHGTLEQMIAEGDLTQVQQRKLESILEEVQRLSVLSGQLIFLAKADAAQMAIDSGPVALDELVREISEDCVELGRHRGIKVELLHCDAVTVQADKTRLRQMLLNLADNAVKYNRDGGMVSMALTAKNNSAHYVIRNEGPVVPELLRSRIFERFFRYDGSRNSSADGSGLGLSIVAIIVALHGGRIAYDVDDDGLNRFSVIFPLRTN